MQVTTHVHQFGGLLGKGFLGANVFLLTGNDLTLVDTGFWGRSRAILRGIRRLGYSPSDVARIIITHHHADHAGSLATLKRITGAEVIAHSADAPYLDGSLPQPGPSRPQWLSKALAPAHRLWATAPAEVDTLVNDGDELPILGGVKILHMPGHTPGSICLLLEQEGMIIVGDVIVHRFGLRLPVRLFTVDVAQAIRSVKRVAGTDFDVICFGHGSPIPHKARSRITRFAESL
ncbi:MBL fold metallo-hydrolase [Chloroflexota bacterium]